MAAAAMATSMFAADIAAKVQLESDLFSFNTDTSAVSVFGKLENKADPDVKFSITTETR